MKAVKRKPQVLSIQWIRLGAFLGLIAFFILILLTVENMLLSAVIALVINYLLSPLVSSLERARVPRLLSTLVVFVLGGVFVGIGITAIVPFLKNQTVLLQAQLPVYIVGVKNLIFQAEHYIQAIIGIPYKTGLGGEVESLLFSSTRSAFEDLPRILSKLGTTLLLSPFFAFFLIKDGRLFSKAFLSLVPNHIFELTLNMYYQINEQMGQFVRARILESIIIALVVWIGLWTIDFPFATLISLFAGATNLIPYIGPFIGAVPAIAISLINGDSAFTIFAICGIFGLAQLIDIFFIIPLVVAKIVNLHPITVVVAMIVGAEVLGVLGMIISIPVASALKVTSTSIYKHLVEFRA